MRYEEITTQKIEYSSEDIIHWVKTFASRQLGIVPDEISDNMITISPKNLKDIVIDVTYIKKSSNANINVKENET